MFRYAAVIALLALPAFAEDAKEPTVAELKAQVAALKAENDSLKQRLTLTDARCKALAEFYQTDAALKQLDQQKEKK